MSSTLQSGPRNTRELLVSFIDLSSYTRDAHRTDEATLADRVDAYYELVAGRVQSVGGVVVKFIGDGTLLVFPTEQADAAVQALIGLKTDVDARMKEVGWESRLVVKVHAGTVVAGGYGAAGAKTFDVIGDTVNVAARLQTRGFAVSPQVFRLLSKEQRQLLKKHTPPVLYIPVDEHRPG